MEKAEKNRYARTAAQVDRTRKLYSRIGEPLPAEIIIELYQHLGKALEAADLPAPERKGGASRADA